MASDNTCLARCWYCLWARAMGKHGGLSHPLPLPASTSASLHLLIHSCTSHGDTDASKIYARSGDAPESAHRRRIRRGKQDTDTRDQGGRRRRGGVHTCTRATQDRKRKRAQEEGRSDPRRCYASQDNDTATGARDRISHPSARGDTQARSEKARTQATSLSRDSCRGRVSAPHTQSFDKARV